MKALCWHGKNDVRLERVTEPRLLNPRDCIVRVTSTAICGSDLHLYAGFIPGMKVGDILGHEFMGEVVDKGPNVKNLKIGDRVVVPFPIACGGCFFCRHHEYALCDNSNPNAEQLEKANGAAGAGIFGYSHLYGGYAGGQSEFVRVPFADTGPIRIPDGVMDERVLFLSDILPTAWQAAEQALTRAGDTVAIWGCGPVGLLAIRCAWLLGAGRVIAIDRFPERLRLAEAIGHADVINHEEQDVMEELAHLTGGRGPDGCIDAIGMEAHGNDLALLYDRVKQAISVETDRPIALRQAIQACRKGGNVSIPGIYGGFVDKIPLGAAFAKGLTLRMGQTHVQRYMARLLELILNDELDTTFIITHRLHLNEGPSAYEAFKKKEDSCIKVILHT